jgi:hypothetical protein
MDSDSEGRLEISKELARLLAQQTEFFKNGARRGHTPDELREFEQSRAHVQVLFELLEQRRKSSLASDGHAVLPNRAYSVIAIQARRAQTVLRKEACSKPAYSVNCFLPFSERG